MKVAIIKYNAGNIQSVDFALRRLGVEAIVTDIPEQILSSDRVIFPGVGEASTTMEYLRAKSLDRLIIDLKQPVLGICLGLQLMCQSSDEGNTTCLGIFQEKVVRFNGNIKVPHMGWNTVSNFRSKLFDSEHDGIYMYFVHSYYAELGIDTIAETEYGNRFSSALAYRNYFATQFHPEKSGDLGSKILENFLFKI